MLDYKTLKGKRVSVEIGMKYVPYKSFCGKVVEVSENAIAFRLDNGNLYMIGYPNPLVKIKETE